jgi:hypothetical protein
MKVLDKYLRYLEFGMPTSGIMASPNRGYKQLGIHPSSAIKRGSEEEDEEVNEYTSYNPHGDGYGRMMQRWNIAGSGVMGQNTPVQSAPSSQKSVKQDIIIKIKDLEKKAKEKKDEDD